MENFDLTGWGPQPSSERMEPAAVRQVGLRTTLVLSLMAIPASANAVDLNNRDRADREVTINHADGKSEMKTVKAGQRLTDICTDCVVLVGDSSVEVKGQVTVRIERGKVSVAKR